MDAENLAAKLISKKKYLIIESEQFRFKQFISDISSQDIKAHNNDIKQYVVFEIGYQIKQQIEFRVQVIIYNEYELFLADLPGICQFYNWVPTN